METIVVTAAVIRQGDYYLLAQRKKGSHQELKWEFPGGKVEKGEHPEQCLIREIKEELDVSIRIEDIFQVVSHVYGEKHIILLCYKCEIYGGEISCIDCADYRWVKPEQMMHFDCAPADIPVIQKIISLEQGE